jgi:pyrroloquinoline quinone (PQQ) biosynthesis protein C
VRGASRIVAPNNLQSPENEKTKSLLDFKDKYNNEIYDYKHCTHDFYESMNKGKNV